MEISGKIRRAAAAAAATVLVAGATWAALAPPSVADPSNTNGSHSKAPRTVQVSGQLIPKDAIGSAHEVTGALIGTWYFPDDPFNKVYYESDTRIFARGAEYFKGCVNLNGNTKCDASEPSGIAYGEYMYWALLDRDKRLVDGGCTHAFTGGTKAFKGARGMFHMRDVFSATSPAGSVAGYHGEIILNAVNERELVKTAATTVGARTASGGKPTGC